MLGQRPLAFTGGLNAGDEHTRTRYSLQQVKNKMLGQRLLAFAGGLNVGEEHMRTRDIWS